MKRIAFILLLTWNVGFAGENTWTCKVDEVYGFDTKTAKIGIEDSEIH